MSLVLESKSGGINQVLDQSQQKQKLETTHSSTLDYHRFELDIS